MFCQLCDGQLALLGRLGRLTHTRCINCGMQFSHETTPDELDDETDDEE